MVKKIVTVIASQSLQFNRGYKNIYLKFNSVMSIMIGEE